MTFSDWRTESSGMITTDSISSNNSTNNMHEYYNDSISLQPKITARYPLIDHYDHPLQDENVIFFCHPSGSVSVRTQPHMPKVRLVVVFVVVCRVTLTGMDTVHRNTCVTILFCISHGLILPSPPPLFDSFPHKGAFLCRHGWYGTTNIRYVFDIVGTPYVPTTKSRCE